MTTAFSDSIVEGADGWQAGFLALLPAIRAHARVQFRRLAAERREDAVQEAVASACESFHRLAAQGRPHVANATSLATYAVRRTRRGRHVGGRQDGAKDVLSAVAQRRHGFATESYDRHDARDGAWQQMAIANRKTSIPDLVAFRIDFARWLRTWARRDRRVIAALVRGAGTAAVAGQFGVSPGRVSQLRRRYERAWQVFQGDAGGAPVSSRSPQGRRAAGSP